MTTQGSDMAQKMRTFTLRVLGSDMTQKMRTFTFRVPGSDRDQKIRIFTLRVPSIDMTCFPIAIAHADERTHPAVQQRIHDRHRPSMCTVYSGLPN